ncbi:tudor and KH domain-containing protein homolog isoform X2 [Leguminivora glycinivorella]|uniref:tudor and KH domain-containing protein homolog isoform X2 n=1 Tax=Leguminivora glycinivorella TaxID=1035111 RepID=UPI00200BC862|nr:tudor and KH domain-containing protein homolog isoform X2 [Leguminivora glycinivorella]
MPVAAKFIVPVALGLSLVTVTAFVVYYVFKKDEEAGDSKPIATSRVNTIEVNVPKSLVPALIGRSGSNIKDIEHKSGAKINFKKFPDKDYDICVIRGESHTSQTAENLIREFMKQQPVIVEDTLVVPNWACGRIIGTGGENINDISHRSGARVKVDGPPQADNASQRHVTFRGTKEQIEVAKGLVSSCVAQEKCRREIEQSKRSPRHVQVQPATSAAGASAGAQAGAGTQAGAGDHVEESPEAASSSIEVYVSAVSSPARFWVQFVGPQVSQLDELVEHMTEYYGDKANREAHALTSVSVGQVVAAVFRHDGRWYRARVHDIRPNEFDATKQVADVFYLDYGDSEYVATHELCELRADLLRLRFQAMECFLAGVAPAGRDEDVVRVTAAGQRWEHWPAPAVERFEQLAQVARWKPLVSKTCTYKKTATEDQKEKEIPGIKLYDVTEEGELDIGAVLVAEGHAAPAPAHAAPRASPPRAPPSPFGDLGASRVLGMVENRSSSLPRDHKEDHTANNNNTEASHLATSKSLGSGIEASHTPVSMTNADLSRPKQNGSHALIEAERGHEADLHKTPLDELKANINRIDSHHGNLESLGRLHEL